MFHLKINYLNFIFAAYFISNSSLKWNHIQNQKESNDNLLISINFNLKVESNLPFRRCQMGCRQKMGGSLPTFRRWGFPRPTSPQPCCGLCSGWFRGPGIRGSRTRSRSDRSPVLRTRSLWFWGDPLDREVNFPASDLCRRWTTSGGSPRPRRFRRCKTTRSSR